MGDLGRVLAPRFVGPLEDLGRVLAPQFCWSFGRSRPSAGPTVSLVPVSHGMSHLPFSLPLCKTRALDQERHLECSHDHWCLQEASLWAWMSALKDPFLHVL